MKRIDFLKKLTGVAGSLLLPFSRFKSQQKNTLILFPVRGFSYYHGPALLFAMKPGKALQLIRKPDNPYDPRAIALHYRGRKIGFVPREKNEVISRLLDTGAIALSAEIVVVHKDAAPWEAVTAGIYLRKENSLAA